MPPKLPQKDPGEQMEQNINVALCGTLIEAAHDFLQHIPSSEYPLWMRIIKMMESVRRAATVPFKETELLSTLSEMDVGGMSIQLTIFFWPLVRPFRPDVFAMHIRAQNAALVVRRLNPANFVQFEVFEVSPKNADVMKAEGKLLCSYPGPAIRVPMDTFIDECFLQELSSFLVQMDVDVLDSTPTVSKAKTAVQEVRETVHPKYISGLLVGILRGFGQPADVNRITKRIGDEVLWRDAYKPWRRSPLWLVLRVTLQTSLCINNLYKHFMLFFHGHLLHKCLRRDFPSELFYAMRVKMTRRLSKLGPVPSERLYKFVHDTARETEALLSKRWTAFQEIGSTIPTLQPKELDFVADTHISLNSSYEYLTKILGSVSHGRSQTSFEPQESRLYPLRQFSQFLNDQLSQAIIKNQHIATADFELSVKRNLQSWVAANIGNKRAPDVIASCLQQYYARAKDLYGTNPEDNSIMILTIMDLWMALDRIVVYQLPMLKEYSPEIPSNFLQDLLLHRKSTINRALHIEEYLRQRHMEAFEATSVFSNDVHKSCFAVKNFRTSQDLKRLYDEINAHAEIEREEKRVELNSLNQQSDSLLHQASRMDHKWSDDFPPQHKRKKCKRCKLERQAKALEIHIHEWPLPSSTVHAQRVVFELSPPSAFSIWRDITYKILRDIGQSTVTSSHETPQLVLNQFSGLSWCAVNKHRVTIASTTKSFADQTHYQMVQIPAQESSVLVNNGLSFKPFDRIGGSWVVDTFSESSIARLCIPSIPKSSPYNRLRLHISGTQHTANDVIAAQDNCPKEISLHEYVAFSGLRSGPRLQWLNIARELASPSLSFRREEVHTLITQAAWQLGPLSDGVREWHVDLGISSFGNVLLRELESLLGKIKANWLEDVTVRTIGM